MASVVRCWSLEILGAEPHNPGTHSKVLLQAESAVTFLLVASCTVLFFRINDLLDDISKRRRPEVPDAPEAPPPAACPNCAFQQRN